MSWNINLYAEKYNKKTLKWELVGCFSNNFKWNLRGTSISECNEFDRISIENVSEELRTEYTDDSGNNSYFDAKVVSNDKLSDYAIKMIDKSVNCKKMAFIALGMPEYTDDEYAEIYDPDKYDDEGKINPTWNPMTFPISKEILEKVQECEFDEHKGYKILGILEAVEGFVTDWDTDIRFILVGC